MIFLLVKFSYIFLISIKNRQFSLCSNEAETSGIYIDFLTSVKSALFQSTINFCSMYIYQLFRFSLFISVSIYFLPLTLSLNCYSCYFSYNEVFDADNVNQWCTNGTLKLKDENEVVKPCANWENYCVVSFAKKLDFFKNFKIEIF
jgi:hypothetical protein